MRKLMVVEDNEEIRRQLRWGLGKEYEILPAGNRKEAIYLFKKLSPKVVTLDLGLPPDEDGAEEGFLCLEEMLSIAPSTKVIVITGNEGRENALRAVQSGAYDYYQKPIELGDLKIILSRAYHLSTIEEENSHLMAALEQNNTQFGSLVGHCQQMEQIFSTIRKVASSEASVLITGESGTGKELVAKAIHGLSLRKDAPFIPINCGAIPENLLESELFGFEKGAFTGANTRVQGKVEYAHKGTLFLDEIGELPLNLQVKILRFLQEKVIQRVGGREDIAVNARIIAATNRDIARMTEEGAFREDLFYRLAVIQINLPPLRERGDDILLLANLFLSRLSAGLRKKVRGFSAEALKLIQSYEWPGNVRELENKIQRAVIMSDSSLLEPVALGFTHQPLKEEVTAVAGMTLKEAREKAELETISVAIENQGGNMARAAEMLGISRPTLYDLFRKHGLLKPLGGNDE
ncbi:MAG: PEP-CTERM-box response regulator transcription factor [Geobacteraceae bacterium]|jgi:two-component system NtrC family response regulator